MRLRWASQCHSPLVIAFLRSHCLQPRVDLGEARPACRAAGPAHLDQRRQLLWAARGQSGDVWAHSQDDSLHGEARAVLLVEEGYPLPGNLIEDHGKAVDVHLLVIALGHVDLGGHPLGSAHFHGHPVVRLARREALVAVGSLHSLRRLQGAAEAEVRHLDLGQVVVVKEGPSQQQVQGLQVPVNYRRREAVQVLHRASHILTYSHSLRPRQLYMGWLGKVEAVEECPFTGAS
mmetsp:Transcript_58859/g.155029  ORF Transcript_58859/g.155029 Transcript_58859/m.155029 type:complete len:233 (-) Transcript_58859:14-712(-)